jgi:hypothetical protein
MVTKNYDFYNLCNKQRYHTVPKAFLISKNTTAVGYVEI